MNETKPNIVRNPYQTKRKRPPSDQSAGASDATSAVSGPPGHAISNVSIATASDLIVSATDKAGMDGIDREAIDAIILKESGNSLFMQQQRRRDEKVNEKIAALRKKL